MRGARPAGPRGVSARAVMPCRNPFPPEPLHPTAKGPTWISCSGSSTRRSVFAGGQFLLLTGVLGNVFGTPSAPWAACDERSGPGRSGSSAICCCSRSSWARCWATCEHRGPARPGRTTGHVHRDQRLRLGALAAGQARGRHRSGAPVGLLGYPRPAAGRTRRRHRRTDPASTVPSSAVATTTTCSPASTAEAALVPCALAGIRQMSRAESPRERWY